MEEGCSKDLDFFQVHFYPSVFEPQSYVNLCEENQKSISVLCTLQRNENDFEVSLVPVSMVF